LCGAAASGATSRVEALVPGLARELAVLREQLGAVDAVHPARVPFQLEGLAALRACQ
jgi:hypothetical protein